MTKLNFKFLIPENPQSLYIEGKWFNFSSINDLMPLEFSLTQKNDVFSLDTELPDGQPFKYEQEGKFPRSKQEKSYIAYRILRALLNYKKQCNKK